MNIANLVVTKGLVVAQNTTTPQLIQVTASTTDIQSGIVDLKWQNVSNDGNLAGIFATANVVYGGAFEWLSSWTPIAHLIQGRIEALENLALQGKASRFSRNMAYNLFAANCTYKFLPVFPVSQQFSAYKTHLMPKSPESFSVPS